MRSVLAVGGVVVALGAIMVYIYLKKLAPLPTRKAISISTPGTTTSSKYILALGDSYTIGQGVPESGRWPVQLAKALNAAGIPTAEPVIIARTGWTTADLSAALKARDIPPSPDLVTLQIGVNDQFQGYAESEYKSRFASLLQTALVLAGNNAEHVIVVSIPDWGRTPFGRGEDTATISAAIDRFNDINKTEADRVGVRYVTITDATRAVATDLSFTADDGLHPSAKMYTEWVKVITPVALMALSKP